MTIISVQGQKQSGPAPASGKHAEILGDIVRQADMRIRHVEAERSGVGLGQGCWVGGDPVLDAAQKLVKLAEQRIGCIPR
jgi:hypothetical protein